jgi:hypothetical protein
MMHCLLKRVEPLQVRRTGTTTLRIQHFILSHLQRLSFLGRFSYGHGDFHALIGMIVRMCM